MVESLNFKQNKILNIEFDLIGIRKISKLSDTLNNEIKHFANFFLFSTLLKCCMFIGIYIPTDILKLILYIVAYAYFGWEMKKKEDKRVHKDIKKKIKRITHSILIQIPCIMG
ncbi:LOW QUALITY PROTEIN: hypothetical protein V1478_018232 [Vespula squamosa]|uniref:Uncharacterized protein n=1 Tax=Vespula squamosa TaxID=30214 RepID=A0ABD1ZV43_VESSQ